MEREKIKGLLNNTTLLKWVKKFSADNLLDDNKMGKKFNIKSSDESISILDTSATKLFVTNSEFEGEELVRFNLKQLADLLEIVGKEKGELVIPKNSEMNEMIAQIGNDIAVVCPLAKQDKNK